MKAIFLLSLALAAPAVAQTDGTMSPGEAAKLVLETCTNHATSSTPLVSSNVRQFEEKGLKYQREAPEFLASTKSTALGIAEYVRAPSTQGEVWAIGYDSSACMVAALGVPVPEVEKGFKEYFEGSRVWRSERASPSNDPGLKVERYAANPRRSQPLEATVNLREADNQATITMVRAQR